MTYRKSVFLLGFALLMGVVGYGSAQSPVERTRTDRDSLPQPIHRVAHKSTDEPEAKTAEHPLEPALEIARRCMANIETNIQDYSATLGEARADRWQVGRHGIFVHQGSP